MKLLESAKKDVDQDKNGENVSKLESVEVVLVHCNLINKNCQQVSKVLFTFVPDKQLGQLVTTALHSLTMLKTTNAEFQSIEVCLQTKIIDHLKIEDNVNIALMIGTD